MNVKEGNIEQRKAFHAKGYKGQGLVFCVIDTGVNPVGWLSGKVSAGTKDGLEDGYNHGTFVAGQLIEWCPEAEVISYKVFDASGTGGRAADITAALLHIRSLAEQDRAKRYITNMSLTCPLNKGSKDHWNMESAIDALTALDCPVVACAGNDGTEVTNLYPGCFLSPYTASAIDEIGMLAWFSTYHNEVDFADFGVNVPGINNHGDNTGKSGTSFAAPNVAGKIGLYMSMIHEQTGAWPTDDAIYAYLQSCAVDLRTSGRDPHTGYGYISLALVEKTQETQMKENNSMSTILDQFIDYLWEQVNNHSIYVWGAQGQTNPVITEAWIKKRENSPTNAARAIKFWKKQVAAGYGDVLRAFDCSGLGMYFFYNIKGILASDMTAATMRKQCTDIKKAEARKGDWCFRVDSDGDTYHIGYVVDDAGTVIEAKGRDDGVIASKIDAISGYWTHFGRPKQHVYGVMPDEPDIPEMPSDASSYYGVCTGGSVNVRTGPGTEYAKIGIAHKDDPLLVYEDGNAWPQVALLLDGKLVTGYMSDQYVQKVN